jgi:nucleoside-diphosphate-sugar epimerase
LKRIGILGCGWLGTQLASSLNAQNWVIKASRTSGEGALELKQQGLNSFCVLVTEAGPQGELSFFDNLDQLIVSIPPKRNTVSTYGTKINQLIYYLESNSNCKILLLSSTSIYGKKSGRFDENSIPDPQTSASEELLIAEDAVLRSKKSGVVVRLGGLVGNKRNPIFQLSNRVISNPKGHINFIHQKDAIGGIEKLLSKPGLSGVFNLVSPHHPIREDYYTFIARKYHLPTPKFETQGTVLKRWINASKIEEETDFQYQVNNLLI